MSIGTKNGSIIVKDGGVAENCDCCEKWYCYGCNTTALQETWNRLRASRLRLNFSGEIQGTDAATFTNLVFVPTWYRSSFYDPSGSGTQKPAGFYLRYGFGSGPKGSASDFLTSSDWNGGYSADQHNNFYVDSTSGGSLGQVDLTADLTERPFGSIVPWLESDYTQLRLGDGKGYVRYTYSDSRKDIYGTITLSDECASDGDLSFGSGCKCSVSIFVRTKYRFATDYSPLASRIGSTTITNGGMTVAMLQPDLFVEHSALPVGPSFPFASTTNSGRELYYYCVQFPFYMYWHGAWQSSLKPMSVDWESGSESFSSGVAEQQTSQGQFSVTATPHFMRVPAAWSQINQNSAAGYRWATELHFKEESTGLGSFRAAHDQQQGCVTPSSAAYISRSGYSAQSASFVVPRGVTSVQSNPGTYQVNPSLGLTVTGSIVP